MSTSANQVQIRIQAKGDTGLIHNKPTTSKSLLESHLVSNQNNTAQVTKPNLNQSHTVNTTNTAQNTATETIPNLSPNFNANNSAYTQDINAYPSKSTNFTNEKHFDNDWPTLAEAINMEETKKLNTLCTKGKSRSNTGRHKGPSVKHLNQCTPLNHSASQGDNASKGLSANRARNIRGDHVLARDNAKTPLQSGDNLSTSQIGSDQTKSLQALHTSGSGKHQGDKTVTGKDLPSNTTGIIHTDKGLALAHDNDLPHTDSNVTQLKSGSSQWQSCNPLTTPVMCDSQVDRHITLRVPAKTFARASKINNLPVKQTLRNQRGNKYNKPQHKATYHPTKKGTLTGHPPV